MFNSNNKNDKKADLNILLDKDFKYNPVMEALFIAGVYCLFGALWIWLSDKVLSLLVKDIAVYSKIQTIKGWLYVFITSFLVYILVRTRSNFVRSSIFKIRESHKNLELIYNELVIAEEKLKNTIYHDSLTGLFTRLGLELESERLIESNIPFVFIHIDFDNFKYINDTLGHVAGDAFLAEMAKRLKSSINPPNIVGRLAGDEFGIIFCNNNPLENLETEIISINKAFGSIWKRKDYEFFISTSMGISSFPKDGATKSQIFRSADLAMSKAKKDGKARGVYYTGDILENNSEKIKISNQLQYAIEKEEFVLYYQPQINLKSGSITGFEVLIRWINPFTGFISPAVFIPIAEETGQIFNIEKWIFKNALEQKQIFEEKGYRDVELSINLSSKTIMSNVNFQEIENLLNSFNIDYSHITLEVTETAIISDIELAISRLVTLKSYGLKLALDDFGTGYSSLTHLKRLPIDIIKLDRTFIKAIEENDTDTFIIKSILYLALDLNYDVVAEGIETKEQYQFLQNNNCKYGQGFLMAKPLTIKDVYEKLANSYNFEL